MDTVEAPPPRRIFRYQTFTSEPIGPEYTIDQVRQNLLVYFPELAQATTEERTLADGTVEVTFRKQVTTKGSDEAALRDELLGRLGLIPRAEDPFNPFWAQIGQSQLTYRLLDAHRLLLDDCQRQCEAEAQQRHEVIQQCQTIQPIPLPHLPLGF
jgi:PRTRC genetic system protein C